ncbi:MAG: GDSL-type esterase/lipase family protein [Polaribacter sp.]|nr:GDSL-type esterase/lipase family protein [Polaribacter sp.]
MKYLSLRVIVSISLFMSLKACTQSSNNQNELDNENLTCTIPSAMYPSDKIVIATHTDFTKKHYPERIASFKENPLSKNDIVFLGNSITENAGDWGKRFNNPKAKNRGISGDTTEGVLARLDELTHCEPKKVFILIGINDLFRDDMTSEKVYENILKIVNQIHEKSPNTNIFVHTILPTSTLKIREKIQMTNELLKNSASNNPYQLIELHTEFTDKDGLMNMNLSNDGVHLNETGYRIWMKKIINLISL